MKKLLAVLLTVFLALVVTLPVLADPKPSDTPNDALTSTKTVLADPKPIDDPLLKEM